MLFHAHCIRKQALSLVVGCRRFCRGRHRTWHALVWYWYCCGTLFRFICCLLFSFLLLSSFTQQKFCLHQCTAALVNIIHPAYLIAACCLRLCGLHNSNLKKNIALSCGDKLEVFVQAHCGESDIVLTGHYSGRKWLNQLRNNKEFVPTPLFSHMETDTPVSKIPNLSVFFHHSKQQAIKSYNQKHTLICVRNSIMT